MRHYVQSLLLLYQLRINMIVVLNCVQLLCSCLVIAQHSYRLGFNEVECGVSGSCKNEAEKYRRAMKIKVQGRTHAAEHETNHPSINQHNVLQFSPEIPVLRS